MNYTDSEPEQKQLRSNKNLGIKLLASLPIIVISLVAIFNLGYFKQESVRPYRYRFDRSLPGNANPKQALQNEIGFYQERIRRNPTGGIDLAILAGVYLKMARATGEGSWYLLAEQAAQRSLVNLPFHNNGAVLALARVAIARHDFQEAIRLVNQVRQREPNNGDAMSIMVTANLAIGNVEKASVEADSLVEQAPTLGTLALKALVKVNQGKDAEAIENFQQAIAAEEAGETGSAAWVRTLFGRFYYKRGQHSQARQLYNEALRILPRYSPALLNLAELETRLGEYQKAQKHYAQVMAYTKDSATVYDHVVLRSMGRLKDLQGDRTSATAYRTQAEALLRQTATGHGGGSFGHRRELARLLLEGDRPADVAEAVAVMRAEIGIRRDAETLDTLAWALGRSGNWREAKQVIQEAIRSGIRDAGIFYRAGTIEQALGNQSEATKWFQLAQQTDPTFDEQARQTLGLGVGLN